MGIVSHDTDILTVYGGVCKWGNVNLWGMFCGTGRLRLLFAWGWWGAIDGRIAALADHGQRTLVRVRLRSPISGFVRTCTEGVSVSFPNDSKCGFSFDEIHDLRNLMREPALASALDEVSR